MQMAHQNNKPVSCCSNSKIDSTKIVRREGISLRRNKNVTSGVQGVVDSAIL